MKPHRNIWILLIILVAASGLRLYGLDDKSFWADELRNAIIAQNSWWDTVLKSSGPQGTTPLEYLMTHWMLYIGKDEATLRFPSVLFGVASVFMIYLLGSHMFNTSVGLASAVLLAIAPIHIVFSQELRFYSLTTFTILATVYAFIYSLEHQTWRHWLWFGCILTISLYTHYFSLLVLLALGIWTLIFRRKAMPRFLLSSGAAIMMFFPWVWWDVILPGSPNSNPGKFVMPALIETAGSLFLPGSLVENCGESCQRIGWLTVVGMPLLFIFALLMSEQRDTILLPFLIVIEGYAGILALCAYGQHLFALRYTLVFLPFLIISLTGGLFIIGRKYAVPILLAVISISFLFFTPKIVEIHSTQTKANFRGIANYLLDQMHDDAMLMVSVPEYLLFYEPRLAPYIIDVDKNSVMQEFRRLQSQGKTVWIVPYGLPGRIFQPILNEHKQKSHPTLIPRVYAIPSPTQ